MDIPYFFQSINVNCYKRAAILQVNNYHQLLATFGNSVLHLLGANLSDTAEVLNIHTGDGGIKSSLVINDEMVNSILSSPCFPLNNNYSDYIN
ncbi:hypothetical protein A0H76_1455 [Hepatospora eriocheir]|nr:hypothetical protein A0H76_1455 [Hepatospora eriocheir]